MSAYAPSQLKRLINQEKKLDAEAEAIYRYLYSDERLAERPFLNMGAGQFQHRYWRISDRLYGQEGKRWLDIETPGESVGLSVIDHVFDYSSKEPIDIAANTLEVVYSCHSFEHAFDEHVLFAMEEALRILRPGGVFRVVVPDAELAFNACRRGDRTFFGFLEKKYPAALFVASHTSLVLSPEYDGPLAKQDVVRIIESESFEDAMTILNGASRLVFAKTGDTRGKHVNWFSRAKLEAMLRQAGFASITQSAYGQSYCPILRDTRLFDSTRPGRSAYVEAVKGPLQET